jgi:flagellar biosynthetic protein FliS
MYNNISANNRYNSIQNSINNNLLHVILLYKTSIKCIETAKQAIVNKDIELRFNSIHKSIQIMQGLSNIIDFEKGNNIANVLIKFYEVIILKMHNINMKDDLLECDNVINELQSMLESWEELNKTSNK